MNRTTRSALTVGLAVMGTLLVTACGGGGGGGGGNITPPTQSLTIGGTVSGLSGQGLVLRNNGGNDLAVSANGTFTFTTAIASGGAYAVTVATQPSNPAQTCTVSSGSGSVASANVTSVTVSCTTNATNFTIGGNISGLSGQGLVLRNNGGNDLNVSANGTFTFTTALASGASYAVTVATQPSNPAQTCTIANGSGTVASANVSSVTITCAAPPAASLGFVYTTNYTSSNISAFSIGNGGVLTAVAGSPFSAGANLINSTLTVDPTGKFAYAASQVNSQVAGFAIDQTTGALTAIAGNPFTAGSGPRRIAMTPNGRFAYVNNRGASSVSAYSIDATTGALSPLAGSPFTVGLNPSDVRVNSLGTVLYVANFGANTISAFTIDVTSGALTEISGSPIATGTGPGNIAITSNGRTLYVSNNSSGSVSGFSVATNGALTALPGSPFAAGTSPNALALHPNGGFAYVANFGSDNVSGYTVSATDGVLTATPSSPYAAGQQPIGTIAIDPTGRYAYVANVRTNSVSGYSINQATGVLTALAGSPFSAGITNGTGLSNLAIDPSGAFVYVTNGGAGNLSAFAIDANSGALTPVPGAPFATGTGPAAIAFKR